MINEEKHYDLIKFEDGDFSLDVKVSPDEDTVWLNANQIAILFDRDEKTIRKHITIILKEELDVSTVAKFATVQTEGSRTIIRNINYYNLDMIISVGYRVNSKRGILFRRWATSILKEYLYKGFVVNEERCLCCTSNIINLNAKYELIESKMKELEDTIYSNNDKLIYEGEILEPYKFLRKLFFLAKKELIISDYYADSFLLSMLKDINVSITIITSNNSYLNKVDIPNNIRLICNDNVHGRYICIDNDVYVMDNSFNAIGKKRFVIMKLENISIEMLFKGII